MHEEWKASANSFGFGVSTGEEAFDPLSIDLRSDHDPPNQVPLKSDEITILTS